MQRGAKPCKKANSRANGGSAVLSEGSLLPIPGFSSDFGPGARGMSIAYLGSRVL